MISFFEELEERTVVPPQSFALAGPDLDVDRDAPSILALQGFRVYSSPIRYGAGLQLVSFENPQFRNFLRKVFDVYRDEELDEDKPNETALSAVLDLSITALGFISRHWVSPSVDPDGNCGFRLTWQFAGKELCAVVPGNGANRYLYFEEGASYHSTRNFNAAALAESIAWVRGIQ